MDIKMTVTEPQAEFHALTCKYALFVAGYGSGKTEAMLNQAIMDSSLSSEAWIGLYAPTYALLAKNVMPRLLDKLDSMGVEYRYNRQSMEVITTSNQLGNFRGFSLERPDSLVGYEDFRIHVDELDTLTMERAKTVWKNLVARCRQSIDGHANRICAYTTPEGFKFCYHRWVKEQSDLYGRVHASTTSNPFLPKDYIDSLYETYPKELIKAYIDGEFVNLTGGRVYYAYNRQAHNSVEAIQPNDVLYIGCDFNVGKQAATVYVRREGGKVWHAVDELVDMRDTPDMVQLIKERYDKHKIVMYPDASGGARKSVNASISDIALLRQAQFEVRAKPSNPAVKDRVMSTNTALSKGRLRINVAKCPTTAECLEQQVYDKNGAPDKSSGVDHQNDATTYPIVYEMPVHKPAAQIQFGTL